MATTSRSFVQTLIGAIPAEEGATLVARVGEPARITSSAGSAEVGSIPLTAEAIDEMSAQLLPPDQLQALRQSGACESDFATGDGAGAFSVLAAATDGDRWIEVRRRARVKPPSEETLVAELLSRSFTGDSKSTAPAKAAATSAAAQAPAPVAPPPPPVAPQVPEVALAVAPPEPAAEPSGSSHDLDLPANFEFASVADAKFDADDLSLPGGLLDEPATATTPAAPARPAQAAKPATVAPKSASSPTISDRLRGYARLSILLPAIVAVIGLPGGWFVWMRHSTAAQIAAAPAPRPMLKSKRLSYALLPHALVEPIVGANFSALNVSAPAPQQEPPTPVAPAAPVAPTPLANALSRSGFSIQVAAVRARDEADRIAAKLVQEGYSSYIVSGDGAAAGFYRVRIGAFADRQAAEDVAKKIEVAGGAKPWIVRETR